MKRALINARITPEMNDGSVIVRRARKQHTCHGGHDGTQRTACSLPILAGSIYIEYVGWSASGADGRRELEEMGEVIDED